MDGVHKRKRRGGRNQKRGGGGSARRAQPPTSLSLFTHVDVLPPTSATPTVNLLISGLARPYSTASLLKFLTDSGVPTASLGALWQDTLRTNVLVTLPDVSTTETLQKVIDGREFSGRIMIARFSTLDHIQAAANVSEAKAKAAAAAAAEVEAKNNIKYEGDGGEDGTEGEDSNADEDYDYSGIREVGIETTTTTIDDVTSKEHSRKLTVLKNAADKCARSGRTVASEVMISAQRSDGGNTDQVLTSLLALDMRYHRTTATPRLCWLPPEVSEEVANNTLALLAAERAKFSPPQSYYSHAQPRAPAQTRPFEQPSHETEWGGSRAPYVDQYNRGGGPQQQRSEYFYLPPPPLPKNYGGDNRSFGPPPSYGRRDDFGPPPRRDTEQEYRNPPPPPLFGHHVPEFSRGEEGWNGGGREGSRGR